MNFMRYPWYPIASRAEAGEGGLLKNKQCQERIRLFKQGKVSTN